MDSWVKEWQNYLTYILVNQDTRILTDEYTKEDKRLQDSELITIQRELLHYLLAWGGEYTCVHTHE